MKKANVTENYKEQIKDRKDLIICSIVNTKESHEILKNVPHRDFWDLSIIYRMYVPNNMIEQQCFIIDNTWAHNLGLSESDLYELALSNMEQLMQPVIIDANFFLAVRGVMTYDNEKIPEYIITNEKCVFGTTSIFHTDILQNLFKKIDDDIYLIPSSVHEWLAIPASAIDPMYALHMIREVTNMISSKDILSYNLYFCNRETHKITLVDKKIA